MTSEYTILAKNYDDAEERARRTVALLERATMLNDNCPEWLVAKWEETKLREERIVSD